MMFLLKYKGVELCIKGDDAFSAVRHNMRYIEALTVGCTIKCWEIEEVAENSYAVVIKYYNKQPSRLKRMKNMPPALVARLSMVRVERAGDKYVEC